MNHLLKSCRTSKKDIAKQANISLPTLDLLLKNQGNLNNYTKVLSILDGELNFNVSHIRLIRKQAGLSQDKLSKKAGITQASLSSIEAGNNGRVSNIFKIAKALNHHIRPVPKQATKSIAIQQIIKNTKNNGVLKIATISKQTAKAWILKYHYSKTFNKSFGTVNYGIYQHDKLMGVAVYGHMMNPASHKNICDFGLDSILELNRLHLSDKLKKNAESLFLASTFKLITANYPQVKFIHTFADGRLGCGTIYKASNFRFYGVHESTFFENIKTGEIIHDVALSNTKRPQKFMDANRLLLDGKLKPFTVKTYRYIYALYGDTVKLQEEPFPAYQKGMTEINDYQHPLGVLCRARLLYDATGDNEYVAKVDRLLLSYSHSDVQHELIRQGNSKGVRWLLVPRLGGSPDVQHH